MLKIKKINYLLIFLILGLLGLVGCDNTNVHKTSSVFISNNKNNLKNQNKNENQKELYEKINICLSYQFSNYQLNWENTGLRKVCVDDLGYYLEHNYEKILDYYDPKEDPPQLKDCKKIINDNLKKILTSKAQRKTFLSSLYNFCTIGSYNPKLGTCNPLFSSKCISLLSKIASGQIAFYINKKNNIIIIKPNGKKIYKDKLVKLNVDDKFYSTKDVVVLQFHPVNGFSETYIVIMKNKPWDKYNKRYIINEKNKDIIKYFYNQIIMEFTSDANGNYGLVTKDLNKELYHYYYNGKLICSNKKKPFSFKYKIKNGIMYVPNFLIGDTPVVYNNKCYFLKQFYGYWATVNPNKYLVEIKGSSKEIMYYLK